MSISGTIRSRASAGRNYLVYGGVDTQSVACYYEYDDLQSPPVDSAFWSLLNYPSFAMDSLGGKYIVTGNQRAFGKYFMKKDVVSSIGGELQYPLTSVLYQNYPNPFNPVTTLEYAVPLSGELMGKRPRVRLCVYDILGRQVATLVDEEKQPGHYKTTWQADDVPSGVYFGRLELNETTVAVRKLVLIR